MQNIYFMVAYSASGLYWIFMKDIEQINLGNFSSFTGKV